jgi:hypothetical protein
MPGHEPAARELVRRAGSSISLDMQSRDLVESDRFGPDVRRYAVNGAALVLEGARHWLTDERPDELAARWLQRGRRG